MNNIKALVLTVNVGFGFFYFFVEDIPRACWFLLVAILIQASIDDK